MNRFGKAFVLREGHIVEALRATMAIPGIFTPLERDGRLLVDGGVVNNLPTIVVKDMGADIVLAVTRRGRVEFQEHSYPYIEVDFDRFQPLGKQLTLIAMGRSDSTMGRNVAF